MSFIEVIRLVKFTVKGNLREQSEAAVCQPRRD